MPAQQFNINQPKHLTQIENTTNATTAYSVTPLSTVSLCWLVNVYLKLLHTNVLSRWPMIVAYPHFNVIAHFLAQCGSEPWTTAITASAPTSTPLWVPQRVIKVPLVFMSSSYPRLAEILLSHKWRCSTIGVPCTGAVAAVTEIVGFWCSCCKGPDVVLRTAISHRQTCSIGAV